MKKILVVIDMQNDFITGALPADGGIEIVPRVVEKIKRGNYDKILFTQDTHYFENYKESLEGKNIPAHCYYRSNGWDVIPEIFEMAISKTDISKDQFSICEIYKESFGSYVDLLKEIVMYWPDNEDIEIEICGVCTDICVISNALILRAALPNTRIIVDSCCCAGTTKEAHEAALMVMKNCLIEVI